MLIILQVLLVSQDTWVNHLVLVSIRSKVIIIGLCCVIYLEVEGWVGSEEVMTSSLTKLR